MKQYFHLSSVDLGEQVILKPKVPESAVAPECLSTPRVCFAPTLFQCLLSLSSSSDTGSALTAFLFSRKTQFNNPTVYCTTSRKLVLPNNPECSDYPITQERWSLTPIKVKRLGYLDTAMLLAEGKMVVGPHRGHDLSGREMRMAKALTSLADSSIILKHPTRFQGFMRHIVQYAKEELA